MRTPFAVSIRFDPGFVTSWSPSHRESPCYRSTRVTGATIVYLHGMAGGHLERDGRKVWLNASSLVRGTVAGELSGALNPAGHIKLFHRPAAIYWRRRGFEVHEFAYDWRLSFDDAAARLREAIAAIPAGRRLIVAAHSMGGCVACRFSALYPVEARRIERAFFFGVPVRGTFSAVEVLLGRFMLPRLVAGASFLRGRKEVLAELGTVCSRMPGLIDLLPDPALFPAAAGWFERRNWPEDCAPEQALLDRARVLKREMIESPILERTTVLASSNWATSAGDHTVPGDHVTAFVSATPRPGMTVHALRFPHAFLLFEPSGLRYVAKTIFS